MYTESSTLAICMLLSQVGSVFACPGHFRRDANSTDPAMTPTVATRIRPAAPTSKVALTNVRIFDGYEVRKPSTVVIDGTIISTDMTDIDHVVDGNGGILMPGLIESHAHPDSTSHLETLSSYGITTVLNMNCQNYAVCSSLRDQTGLTSFFTAGLSAKGPNSSHANNAHAPLSQLIWSPTQAAQYVDNVFSNGSDWLKIVSELNGPDQATQNALVEAAHALGNKAMTHAADLASYIMAIESRTDGPQHIPLDGVLNATMLARMHAHNQFATPTMTVFRLALQVPGAAASLGHAGATLASSWPLITQNVLSLKTAGIPILAGTDATPPYAGQEIPFGTTLHAELGYLVEAGLTPAEALRAATLTPALAHGFNDRGRVAPGLRADLLLLTPDADPLVNISDSLKIARVWNGGLEYPHVASS